MAARVGLPRSTVQRIAHTLEREGLLATTVDRRIRIGAELARIAVRSRRELLIVARPFLERLAGTVRETVDLAVPFDGQVRFIDQVASERRLRAASVVGEAFPAYCTANGKALLAELPPRALDFILPAQLPRPTPHTITSRSQLLDELEQVRRTGVAFDREEHTERICAVGAVIRDALGTLAAVTVAAPAERFYGREDELAGALLDTTRVLNEALWE